MSSILNEITPRDFFENVKRQMHLFTETDEPVLAIAQQPDFVTLPEQLGGGRANVLDAVILKGCIVGKHQGEVAVVFVDGGVEVVACPECDQFYWMRRTP